VSLGTGLSIGEAPGRILIDLAYSFSWANDVMGSLVSGQDAVTTDVQSHEVYLSCIVHF
jgi:hypothetical protein